ncbi:hypothetical protein LEP1GSC165_2353 [Leptospira santarosai str. CBC523]|nr:hypothetical protein LEP1GSC165_2353 [Leptospira santarosai str. CBC523]EMP81083.1 hypothetical protein LEP1GSC162_2547 [Leptospira santarosai str. CBC1531]
MLFELKARSSDFSKKRFLLFKLKARSSDFPIKNQFLEKLKSNVKTQSLVQL